WRETAWEPAIVSPPRSAREREEMENWSSRRIRELTPEIALRGMAANKIGCARISMMVRSTSSKARPDTLVQDRTPGSPFSLATHGGSIHSGANRTLSRHRRMTDSDPERTLAEDAILSQTGRSIPWAVFRPDLAISLRCEPDVSSGEV